MTDLKTSISLIAILLTFVGYGPYIRDIFKRKTIPHVFTWLIWGVVTSTIYALQVSAGAGPGSWVTLSAGLICFFVFFLGLRYGDAQIKPIDIIFLLLAFLALGLWIVVDQPILSATLLSTIDMFGFAPTIRKSWNDPHSETLSFYSITALRHALSFFGLIEYTIVTWLYPVTWTIANALFALILFIRRKKIDTRHI